MKLACLCRSKDRSGGIAEVGASRRYSGVGLGLWLVVLLAPTVAHADGVFTPFVGMSAGSDQTERVTTYGPRWPGWLAGSLASSSTTDGRPTRRRTASSSKTVG